MKIAFVHNSNAFLPEIEAYVHYFSSLQFQCSVVNSDQLKSHDYDIAWFIMGIDRSPTVHGKLKIHEYSSASTPPLARLKNHLKKQFCSKPDFRIFLNAYVRESFDFRDSVPYGYRDMGIANASLKSPKNRHAPMYDFVYAGDLSASREPEQLLRFFTTGIFRDYSLLVLGTHYDPLKKKYAPYSNIHFEGPYQHGEMINHLQKARFGFNYIPNKEPFNQQTSTKLLEYAAAGLPIVSTYYDWIREFQAKYGGRYYFINNSETPFDRATLNNFNFELPDLKRWTWDEQIKNSGIVQFIEQYRG